MTSQLKYNDHPYSVTEVHFNSDMHNILPTCQTFAEALNLGRKRKFLHILISFLTERLFEMACWNSIDNQLCSKILISSQMDLTWTPNILTIKEVNQKPLLFKGAKFFLAFYKEFDIHHFGLAILSIKRWSEYIFVTMETNSMQHGLREFT